MIKTVIKSNGDVVNFEPEKFNKKLRWASERKVNWSDISFKALRKLSDNCTTADIDKAIIDTCVEAFDEKHFMLAGRVLAGVDFGDLPLTLGEEVNISYVVYSKPECPFCVKLKNFMEDNNILYQDIRVDLYPEEKDWLMSKGLRTVPQVFDQEGNYHGDCTSFIQKHA